MKYNWFENIIVYLNFYYNSRKFFGKEKLRESLNIYNLFNIVDKIKLEYPLKKIFFLGEPFLWDPLSSAVNHFQKKQIKLIVVTTGLHKLKYLFEPIDIEINLRKYIDIPNTRELIKNNIKSFLVTKSKLSLKWNFQINDNFNNLEIAQNLAKELSLDLVVNTGRLKLGNNLVQCQENINKIFVEISKFKMKDEIQVSRCPLPLCIELPQSQNRVESCFDCSFFNPTFYPDGKTMKFCDIDNNIFNISNCQSLLTLEKEIFSLLKKRIRESLKFEECTKCYLKKRCQGGCFTN